MSEKVRKLKNRIAQSIAVENYKAALRDLERCLKLSPRDFASRQQMAQCLVHIGQKSDAVTAYAKLAADYASDGMLLKAITINKIILTLDADHTDTQNSLARLYARQKGDFRNMQLARSMTPVTGAISKEEILAQLEDQKKKDSSEQAEDQMVQPGSNAPATLNQDDLQTTMELEIDLDVETEIEMAEDAIHVTLEDEAGEISGMSSLSDPAITLHLGDLGLEKDGADDAEGAVGEMDPGHLSIPALLDIQQSTSEIDHFESVNTDIQFVAGSILPKPPLQSSDSGQYVVDMETADLPAIQPAVTPEQLPSIPLFSELDANAFIRLTEEMVLHQAQPGEILIQEGAVATSFYSIIQGTVRVYRGYGSDNPVLLAELSDGNFFGEMALLTDAARTASVIAAEETVLFEISKTLLDNIIREHPQVRQVLLRFHRNRLLTNLLSTCPIFFPFSKREKRELVQCFQSRSAPAGSVLINHKQQGNGLHILLSGECDVVSADPGAMRKRLAILRPGDVFGEMSLLGEQPAMASVISRTPCIILRMPKTRFVELVEAYPLFLGALQELVKTRDDKNQSHLQMTPEVRNNFLL
jgi:CRP-like cAMP-binding protein